MHCRNCNSANVIKHSGGRLAPFFLKRVLGVSTVTLGDALLHKIQNRGWSFLYKLVKLAIDVSTNTSVGRFIFDFRGDFPADLAVCKDCLFVGPYSKFSDSSLLNFYKDYRAESYNSERIAYERAYKSIANLVGKNEIEKKNRVAHVDTLLRKHDLTFVKSVLDVGGSAGDFIPTSLRDRQVYIQEVSSEPLRDKRYTRVDRLPDGLNCDFIQINHVLEHVANPQDFVKSYIRNLSPGGYLYLEVPKDRNEDELKRFCSGDENLLFYLHEHINLYCSDSLSKLGASLRLEQLELVEVTMDCGWCIATIVSGLFRKPVCK